jgi:uncharacterized membrane protein
VAAITIVGLGLRLININSGLWYDEVFNLVEYVRHPVLNIISEFRSTNNHLLYSLLAHFSISIFGEHAWSLRLPALVFGVGSIPLIFLLGDAFGRRREGILAACLLAVSYHHIWFSQNGRGYTVLLFCTLLATWLFVQVIQNRRSAMVIAYGVTAAIGTYAHLTMILIVMSHALLWAFWLWSRKDQSDWRSDASAAVSAVSLAAVGTVLLYLPLIPQVLSVFLSPPQSTVTFVTPTWAVLETIKGLIVGLGGIGLLAGGVLGVAGLVGYWRQSRFTAAILVVPCVVTVLGIVASGTAIRPRFFFALLGFVLLVVVRGAMVLGERLMATAKWGRGDQAGTAFAGVLILFSLASLPYLYRYPKQDFEGTIRFIEDNRLGGEQIGTGGLASYPLERYYGLPSTRVETIEEFGALHRPGKAAWLVYSFPEYMDGQVVEAIEEGCSLEVVLQGTLGGGEIIIRRCDAE